VTTREKVAELLRKHGVSVAKEGIANSEDEAVSVAGKIGYPIALKIISSEIIHKTDRGCVKINLMNERELRLAYKQIMQNAGSAKIEGMLVQRMIKQGIELIVGGRKDAQFGQLILFGLGGIFVEILKDVSIRVCPVTKDEAREMINEIKGSALLKGARGTEHVDTEKLASMIVGVSKVLSENEDILELDLNPVIASASGYEVVDIRVIS